MNNSLFPSQEAGFRALVALAPRLKRIPEPVIRAACRENPWFSPYYIKQASGGIAAWLREEVLERFVREHPLPAKPLHLGIVTAGNLPLVGFHDLLVGLLAGARISLQCSRRDTALMAWVVSQLMELEPVLAGRIVLAEKISLEIDRFIATGSDNAARYFQYHFSGIPGLIRRNRTSVAILNQDTSDADLELLTEDVFLYNGLGCRNVTMLCAEKGFPWERLRCWEKYPESRLTPAYRKAFRRVSATAQWLSKPIVSLGRVILKPVSDFESAPLGQVHGMYFDSESERNTWLRLHRSRFQCIVGEDVSFGDAQRPKITDFADGVDTMQFLRTGTLS